MPPAKKTAQRKRRRLAPEQRREELLAAVEQVVIAQGFQGMSVPRVVAAAGVSQGNFYRYFDHIDHAFLALVYRVLEPIREADQALSFEGITTVAEVEDRLRGFYQVLGTQLASHGVLLREAFLVAPASQGVAGTELSGFLKTMRLRARDLLHTAAGKPPFRTTDPDIAAGAIIGMILGAAHEAAEQGDSFAPEAWASEMARFEAGALTDATQGR